MVWFRCLPRGEAGENSFENTTSALAELTFWKEAACQKIVVKGVITYVELITFALGLSVWLDVVLSETKAHDEMQLEMSTNGETVPVAGHQTG